MRVGPIGHFPGAVSCLPELEEILSGRHLLLRWEKRPGVSTSAARPLLPQGLDAWLCIPPDKARLLLPGVSKKCLLRTLIPEGNWESWVGGVLRHVTAQGGAG